MTTRGRGCGYFSPCSYPTLPLLSSDLISNSIFKRYRRVCALAKTLTERRYSKERALHLSKMAPIPYKQ
eukprot:15063569-Ditylum_brightwellii.AAC.1